MRTSYTPLYVFFLFVSTGQAANWPQWRGPQATGVTQDKGFPTQWGGPQNQSVRWRAQLPDNNDSQSSPIVWGDRVYVTTSLGERHQVTCYAHSNGKKLWSTTVQKGPWKKTDSRGGMGAPTPCTDGARVYVLFGTAILAALKCDDGSLVWRQSLEHVNFDVAMGGSPVLHGENVILFSGLTKKDSNITAFDRKTGKVQWKTPLPQVNYGHSTPAFATVAGKIQLIVTANRRESGMLGVDPDTGKVLWTAKGDGESATPAIGEGYVYSDSGRGGGGFAIRLPNAPNAGKIPLQWTLNRVAQDLGSPIIVGKHVYRLGQGGRLTCLKLTDGSTVYSESLPGAQSWASPVATGDDLLYFATSGKSFVVQAGAAFKLVATSELPDGNHASPAFANGTIVLKGKKYLYCIAKQSTKQSKNTKAQKVEAAPKSWVSISDAVLARLDQQGQKPAWPGKTAGVTVDPTTGRLYMVISGRGMWQSANHGASFNRIDDNAVGGRCETGYALRMDPAGGRFACFMLDGSSAMTQDAGKTWTPIKNVERGYDWGAVDWSQPKIKTLFARVHERGGLAVLSQDAGATWKEIGREFGPVGVFGAKILMASRGKEPNWRGVHRSTDGGKTWNTVSAANPIGVMTVFKGTGYWLSNEGLLKSQDQGATWKKVGGAKGAAWGPYFGEQENQFVVVDRNGFQMTTDGGQNWKSIAPYPPALGGEFNLRGWMINFGWSPNGNACYVSRMGKPTYKLKY